MLLDLSHDGELTAWLIKTLEPLCDADPNTLAEYVVALLKNEYNPDSTKEALHAVLVDQLHEFLEDIGPFVTKLLVTLESKSYLPKPATLRAPPTAPRAFTAPSTPSSSTNASTSASQPRSRKRSLESDTYGDSQRASQRVRMDTDQFVVKRDGVTDDITPNGIETFIAENESRTPGWQAQPGQPKICYEFFNKGFCRRGDQCRFSHGNNPIVASNLPFMPNGMMPGGFPMGMMMHPGFGLPMMQQQHHNMGHNGGGYGRFGPRRNVQTDRESVILDMTADHTPDIMMQPGGGGSDGMEQGGTSAVPHVIPYPPQDRFQQRDGRNGPHQNGLSNGFTSQNAVPRGGDMSSAPRTSFPLRGGDAEGRRVPGPSKHAGITTIVVDKIPQTNYSEEAVKTYFQQFGSITTVVLDRRSNQALVTFSEHHEANAAVRSPEAPWGNKYAKVFWHNPMFGGAAGAKAVAGSAPVSVDKPQSAKPAIPSLVLNAPTLSHPASRPPNEPDVSRKKLLIQEQKALLEEASTATPERKKEILAKLRELNKEITKSVPPSRAADVPVAASITPKDPAALERERLDAELDLSAATTSESTGQDGNSNYEALKARLERLRAEATSLGIDPMNPDGEPASSGSTPHPSYRGFAPRARGRGRGRGRATFYTPRGRGGGPAGRPSMKLDLRPKKLIVKLGATNPEKITTVQQWFESTGEVEDFATGPTGDVVVKFRSRSGAEHALAKGSNIPGIGPVQLAWHVDGATTLGKPPTSTAVGGINAENLDVEMAHDVAGRTEFGTDSPQHGVEPPEEEADDPESMTAW